MSPLAWLATVLSAGVALAIVAAAVEVYVPSCRPTEVMVRGVWGLVCVEGHR